ncbi:MMPL family transporter [Candidatus Binatia bacterium]|nr:MMPL family transporter [Candidatus Binatia bacterium]
MLGALGHFTYRRRWLVLVLSGLALLLSGAGLVYGGRLSSGEVVGLEAGEARRLVEEQLHFPGDSSFTIVFRSDALTTSDPRFMEAVTSALVGLRADPRIGSVLAPDQAPGPLVKRLVSQDGHAALAIVTVDLPYREAARVFPELRTLVRGGPLTTTFTGYLAFRSDLDRVLEHDLVRAEAISLPLSVLVLLLAFRTAAAAVLPVGVGALAVLGGIAGVLLLSHFTDMAAYTINVASLIGLGVAIDYSLFIVSRYRDELAAGADYERALGRAVAKTGRAVVFSGVAVGVGLSGLVFFRGSFLASMGIAAAIVVTLAVIFALTFLPALLAVLGPAIDTGRVSIPGAGRYAGLWRRIAHWVMKRPVLVLLPTLAFVTMLGLPFWDLRLAGADVTTLPASVEAREGFELLKRSFPDQLGNRILVLVRFPSAPVLTVPRARALYDLGQRIRALPGVHDVESIVELGPELAATLATTPPMFLPPEARLALKGTVGRDFALLQVSSDLPPAGKEAAALIEAIREHRQVADGTLLVGGNAALDLDTTNFILERAPAAIAFVVVVTMIVLFLSLRSVVLPIKAVVMNFLSITASFGALVWIFQEGHLQWLLHFQAGPIDPTLPVLLFCSVFGLSMDYEVLMLTRMREEYDRTGDNTQAVADGLERTGKVVTSAAAIMVVVFGAFGLSRVVVVKAMGVTLALAIALDATLVRVLIVPATMRLFGDLNWWAPAPLLRVLDRLRDEA